MNLEEYYFCENRAKVIEATGERPAIVYKRSEEFAKITNFVNHPLREDYASNVTLTEKEITKGITVVEAVVAYNSLIKNYDYRDKELTKFDEVIEILLGFPGLFLISHYNI